MFEQAMFILKKLITPFLIPPGIIIIVLILAGLWAIRRKRYATAWAIIVLAAILWIVSIDPTANAIIRPLEADLAIPEHTRGDVIIMLGGGTFGPTPDLSGYGTPNAGTMERLVTAARLYKRLQVPIILSGGKVFKTGIASAKIAQRFLIDLGVPADALILEMRSRDTYENALFSKELCDRYHFTRPLLVTTGFHIRRALFCFDKVGLTVTPVPCGLRTGSKRKYHWYDLLPDANAMASFSAGVHEWLGWYYSRLAY
jgi:uncharacterized SAM-binding protein YcdF (DUF218 family)